MTTSVLVVLVNYRRSTDTNACLVSLKGLELPEIELVVAVCDNGSTVSSFESLEKPSGAGGLTTATGLSGVRVINGQLGALRYCLVASDRNLGFAGGNNLAFQIASQHQRFDYVWFLNNDTEVAAASLTALVNRMAGDASIGLCGSTLVYAWNRTLVQCLGGCRINVWTGATTQIGHGSRWPCSVDQAGVEELLHYPAGASILVSWRLLETVGPMTDDYFLFYEEIDWSIRAKRAGFKLGYAAGSVVYHKEGASIGTGTGAKRSALAEYYGMRNKLLFTWRFFPWALPSVWCLGWLQVARRLSQGHWRRAAIMARTLCGFGAVPSH